MTTTLITDTQSEETTTIEKERNVNAKGAHVIEAIVIPDVPGDTETVAERAGIGRGGMKTVTKMLKYASQNGQATIAIAVVEIAMTVRERREDPMTEVEKIGPLTPDLHHNHGQDHLVASPAENVISHDRPDIRHTNLK